MRQIILDTETTGLQPSEGHRIIEIGCIELVNRKFTGNRFHQYINPERDVDDGALAIHGITNHFLKDKPIFAHIADEFMEFIIGAELIIHNAPFDTGFINHELSLLKKHWNKIHDHCRIIDSLVVAKQLHIGQRNSLDALCKRYSIDNSQRDLHGALMDAHLLAQVYLAMTGGQGSLFEESSDDIKLMISANAASANTVIRKIPVLMATSEELEQHEAHLEMMKMKGSCLWDAV